MSSFSIKTIKTSLTLQKGSFEEGGNTKVVEGLATEVTVLKPGLPQKNSADVKIWGLKRETMEQLTMLNFKPQQSQHNTIKIEAGEKGGALSVIFEGELTEASADFNSSPIIAMSFKAESGIYPQQIASKPQTVDGEAQAKDLFSQWANEAGYSFTDEGVTSSVKNSWFGGSPIDKMMKLSRNIDCDLIIDDGEVIILPVDGNRKGNAVLLNKDTGLKGYPTFNQDGIICECIFNPNLKYGGLIKVESIVPKATGTWKINKLTHNLTAYTPQDGEWKSTIEAIYNE